MESIAILVNGKNSRNRIGFKLMKIGMRLTSLCKNSVRVLWSSVHKRAIKISNKSQYRRLKHLRKFKTLRNKELFQNCQKKIRVETNWNNNRIRVWKILVRSIHLKYKKTIIHTSMSETHTIQAKNYGSLIALEVKVRTPKDTQSTHRKIHPKLIIKELNYYLETAKEINWLYLIILEKIWNQFKTYH